MIRVAMRVACTAACVALFALPSVMGAQALRGTVVSGTQPVSGAVLLLIDSLGRTAGKALSREGGEFFVSAAEAGTYQVRVLRIGFSPVVAGPFKLGSGTTSATVRIQSLPVRLGARYVEASRLCSGKQDSSALALSYWEQARTALLAATLTQAARYQATLVVFDREPSGKTERRTVSGQIRRPYESLPADTLAARGYVITEHGTSTYWAPDADVLLSNSFALTHCFTVEDAAAQGGRNVVITFQPGDGRRDRADVRGTIAVDRYSRQLRTLDFEYVGGPAAAVGFRAGGHVEFAPLTDGGWIIPRWEIRVPVVVPARESVVIPGSRSGVALSVLPRVHGGEVLSIERDGKRVWQPGRAGFTVRVADSSGHVAPAGTLVWVADEPTTRLPAVDEEGVAHLDNVAIGARRIRILTPSQDSLGLAPYETEVRVDSAQREPARVIVGPVTTPTIALCGDAARAPGGMVFGSAAFITAGADTATIHAKWETVFRRPRGGTVTRSDSAHVIVQPGGRYHLCGLPFDVPIKLRYALGPQRGTEASLVLSEQKPAQWHEPSPP